ncbi:MAG: DUF1080 domain-containing protein, partial [bacterium]
MQTKIWFVSLLLFVTSCSPKPFEVRENKTKVDKGPVLGRWDVTVYDIQGVYPSWFEIKETNGELNGRFVGRVGSARPIRYIHFDGDQLYLSLPRQYEKPMEDLLFVGKVKNRRIDGQTKSETGNIIRFQAEPAPALEFHGQPVWGEAIKLIQSDLSNWQPRDPNKNNEWRIENDMLINKKAGVDLVTRQTFDDFKLHLEFNFPEGSNSGVYLRGRYEVQIEDSYVKEPSSLRAGGVYGFIEPKKMAIKPAGQWNSYDITLLGRKVTVVFNDELIIDNAEIPGITGGALDSREAQPGPLMLQGDHGPIRYRNILLTP